MMKKFLLTYLILLAVAVCASDAEANVPLKDVQNGYFESYPKSEGYPNIQTAFNSFFEKPTWGVSKPFQVEVPHFQGIATINGKRAKFFISFVEDIFEKGTIRVLDLLINDTKVYGANMLNGTFINHVNPNELLAEIFLNYNGPVDTTTGDDDVVNEDDDYIPGSDNYAHNGPIEATTGDDDVANEDDDYIPGSDNYAHNGPIEATDGAHSMFVDAIDQYTLNAIRGKKHSFEDVAVVQDESGQYTVYIRVWKEKNFYIVRGYGDNTWQNDTSYLIRFWTQDPSVKFGDDSDNIKIGTTLSELSSYFGESLLQDESGNYFVEGGWTLVFKIHNGKTVTITCTDEWFQYPEKTRKYLGLK